MKQLLIIVCLLYSVCGYGQTWDEVFNQKKTQQKYLLEQLAALKVYQGYLAKGYKIAKNGLQTISAIKDGELGLHDLYFQSLKNVNPVIAHSGIVKDILKLQSATVASANRAKQMTNASPLASEKEKQYISQAYRRLSEDCGKTLDELQTIITAGTLSLSDNERLQRLGLLYKQLVSQNKFAHQFANDIQALLAAREQEKKSIEFSRSIQNTKKN